MSTIKVGFQGIPGSFSEEALFTYFPHDTDTMPVHEFEDIFQLLNENKINFGILPLENSSTGAITQVYDLLNQYEAYIVGEVCVKVKHHLLVLPGTQIEDIKEIYSHPQAFEQSRKFLKQYPDWKWIPYYNTAKSAEFVKNSRCKSMAAIGSKKAADLYGLDILQECINSNATNTTRFVILGKELKVHEEYNKISIVLSTKHVAGSLYGVLRHFAEKHINMLKIESRPIPNKPWEYFFYIDFEGNLADEAVCIAIESMKKDSTYFKLLGNYKKYEEKDV